MTITVSQDITEVSLTVTQDLNTVRLQPVINKTSNNCDCDIDGGSA